MKFYLKILSVFVLFYLLVATLVYLSFKKMHVEIPQHRVVEEKISLNTVSLKYGMVLVLDKNGSFRIAMPSDCDRDTIGIVTRVGEDGEVTLKYKL